MLKTIKGEVNMQDIFELREKLNELSNKVEEYKDSHKDILTGKDEYIDLRIKKPQQKQIKDEKEPFSTTPVRIGLLILLLLCVSICVFGLVAYWILQLIGVILPVISIVIIVLSIITLIIGLLGAYGVSSFAFFLAIEVAYTFISRQVYKRRLKVNRENREFNENEYPNLWREYQAEVEALTHEYEKTVTKSTHKIDECEAYFEENKALINKKYYSDLDRIISVIDDQRANKLSDAINLVIRDKRMERATIKISTRREKDVGLYPNDIEKRMMVRAYNCQACPKKCTCIKLYCRMNEFFDKKEDEQIEAEIREAHLTNTCL